MDLEKVIHREDREDLVEKSLHYVKSKLVEIGKAGEGLYSFPVYNVGRVIWLGLVRDDKGKTGGGLFRESAFRSAYKIKILDDRAEIFKISRDELIDLLYDEQQKEAQKDLENMEGKPNE